MKNILTSKYTLRIALAVICCFLSINSLMLAQSGLIPKTITILKPTSLFLSPVPSVSVTMDPTMTVTVTVTESVTATISPTISNTNAVTIKPSAMAVGVTHSVAPSVQWTLTATPTVTPTATPIPPEAQSAYVAFYADPQSDTDPEDVNHQQVVTRILNSGANPVFAAGDLMEDGTQASLDRFNNITSTLRSSRTFYSALGNNDRVEGDPNTPSQLYFNNFSFPNNERWYSVNYGNLHVVVLDSAFGSGSTTQRNWLTADLQSAASQNRITGVVFHHPSFASTIDQILRDNNVDFVIMGHTHSYQHYTSNGIEYFVMGGQPNMTYAIARIYTTHATITNYNKSGGTISTVNFNNR